MRPSTRSFPLTVGLVVLGLLAALLAATAWWATRPQSLGQVIAFLEQRTGGRLAFEGVSGSLLRSIHVDRVLWRTGRAQWQFDQVDGRWSPVWLLLGTVAFHDVHAQRVAYLQSPGVDAGGVPDASWRTRFRMRFSDASIDEVVWLHETDERRFHEVGLNVDVGWHHWTFTLGRSRSPWGELTGDARIDTAPTHALEARLKLQRPDPSPLLFEARAYGDIRAYDVEATLRARESHGRAHLHVVPREEPPIHQVDLQLTTFNPRDVVPLAPQALIEATLKASNDGQGLHGAASLRNSNPGSLDAGRLPIVEAHSGIGSDGGTWRLRDLAVDLGSGGRLAGDASVSDRGIEMRLAGENLDAHAIHAQFGPTRLSATLASKGSYTEQKVLAEARQPNYRFAFAGVVSHDGVVVEKLTANIRGGTFDASGRLDFLGQRRFELRAATHRLDLSQLGRFRSSLLNASLRATGQLEPLLHSEGQAVLEPSTLFGLPASGQVRWRSRGTDSPTIALDTTGRVGETNIDLHGVIVDPSDPKSLDLTLTLNGRSLAELYTVAKLPLPPTEPYKVSGRLKFDDRIWSFANFKGEIGRSDIGGDFLVDLRAPHTFISADLTSDRLDLRDLGGFVGTKDGPNPPGKILPHHDYDLAKLKAADADIRFAGRRIRIETLPLYRMNAQVKLHDGVLRIDPLAFRAAGGDIEGSVTVDARRQTASAATDIRARHLRLDRLAPTVQALLRSTGTIEGRVRLDMHGNSPAALLASANGSVVAVMNGGSVSDVALRLADLDLANTLLAVAQGDRNIEVNCLVADLSARNGVLEPRSLVLDAEHTLVVGEGRIDLGSEAIDITLHAQPKSGSLLALRGPVKVDGTLGKPAAHMQFGSALARTGAAIALGALAGPAAVLPFIQPGTDENVACGDKIDGATRFVRASN
ncbi:MAG TPA: AsmA family protein [Casimicrobiaceae bacterium]|nr:AsmA family protein [Casimicrobiaceae bacterium]